MPPHPELWPYVWDGVPRPFVHPVRTPAGRMLSVDAPADHPWHHGLWFTIKFVNGENFWEEYDAFGVLLQQQAPAIEERPDGAIRSTSALDWVRPDGATVVVRERLELTHRALDDATVLDWDVRLTPEVDVTLDRTPFTTWGGYGGLTLRGRPDWHDTRLRLTDGVDRERVLGDRAPWCALDGEVAEPDGDHPVGFAVLDHPANPGHPVPWYASTRADTYGTDGWSNFLNAAFLWEGPQDVAAGAELRLRYRVLTHDGVWSQARLDAAWDQWRAAS
jgi:hypothetical protein